MRILMLTHAFNSLSQRLFVELRQQGHDVSVEFDINDAVTIEAVALFRPELILCPFLKRAIPEAVWRHHLCLVVHPGIRGDRGPSALDWAIFNGEKSWGVTVLQANAEMDAGAIWAAVEFPMRKSDKVSLYHHEVTDAAVEAVNLAVARFERGDFHAEAPDTASSDIRGQWRPFMRQQDRAIDWFTDDTETVLRKIDSAEGFPGLQDEIFGTRVFLYDAHAEPVLKGVPGEVIARCQQALCRATVDGAVWIGHLRVAGSEHPFKLPAVTALAGETGHLTGISSGSGGCRDIRYEEENGVGYLHFPFYNGAMGTDQCQRLLRAYQQAVSRPVQVIVLMGGPNFWSNGMHLNLIEAAESPADESWRNINAMDDLAEAIITTDSHITIAAMQGNAGAGGVFLARAADEVWIHSGVVLNPHYRDMGNLYGSEYWSYLLPRHAGEEHAGAIMRARLPMGAQEALSLGLADEVIARDRATFMQQVRKRASHLAASAGLPGRLERKRVRRLQDEGDKPLAAYRQQELEQMRLNFYGFDPSYHVARYNFVFKVPKSRTPLTIARHRRNLQPSHRRAA
ncbi:MAG: enoyl-CoA hydratase-related protein [Mariprofundaceae bacterium]|nr:enoyl-CoA hydratase-related protein [Mariprofundaceae bacterium]